MSAYEVCENCKVTRNIEISPVCPVCEFGSPYKPHSRSSNLFPTKAFPTESSCVEFMFDMFYDRKCSCGGTYKPLKARRQFECSRCRHQVAPAKGTIVEKSSTPLTLWFDTILRFYKADRAISVQELRRRTGVTYKCAYRIINILKELPALERPTKDDLEIIKVAINKK